MYYIFYMYKDVTVHIENYIFDDFLFENTLAQ